MAPKELTKHQLSSRLAYSQQTPSFLLKLQNRINGGRDDDDDEEQYLDPEYDFSEFTAGEGGRPPIPRRPPIPKRPSDDPGSASEKGDDDGTGKLEEDDADDEKPQVVVLKEGKHLSERDVENERRREKGLPPLTEPDLAQPQSSSSATPDGARKSSKQQPNLSFSSGTAPSKLSAAKRKVANLTRDDEAPEKAPTKKRAKKAEKKLLSFGDDAP